jgi:hypothetical protein
MDADRWRVDIDALDPTPLGRLTVLHRDVRNFATLGTSVETMWWRVEEGPLVGALVRSRTTRDPRRTPSVVSSIFSPRYVELDESVMAPDDVRAAARANRR